MTPEGGSIEIGRELSDRLIVHKNIDQEIVLTTVDKIRICPGLSQEVCKRHQAAAL